jgi:aminoacrylate hydrolase
MSVFTASDGCRIHYEVSGSGPAVVFVPGLGGDGRFWTGVLRALPQHYTFIVADHRGAGRSDRPEGPYSIGQIAADVIGILDQEKCGQAHFVGHSTGGAVVQTIALDHGERALSAVISGSWARSDARFRTIFNVRLALLEAGLAETYQNLAHFLRYPNDYLASHEAELFTRASEAGGALQPFSVVAARIRMLLDFDRLADLPRIGMPTLVIGAGDDALLPLYYSHQIADAIPHARFHELSGGHFFPVVRPADFAARIEAFLEQVAP